MRIPTTRIYRAFPELDRFTDDQCSRFVRAACKRGWRRHLHRALLIVLTPVAMIILWIVVGLGISLLTDSLGRSFEDGIPYIVLVVLGLVLVIFGPVLGAMLIRDRLLLGRIRFVLRARGTCPACRYSLLGIVVADSNLVICPECGMEVEADPSLNELTTDDEGRARFTPTESIKVRRFWTPKRVRRTKQAAKVAAVFAFIALPLGWGGYEWFLHRQAATAAAERPGVEGVMAFVEAHQEPGVTITDPNGWVAMEAVADEAWTADLAVLSRPEFDRVNGRGISPDFSLIYLGIDEDLDEDRLGAAVLQRDAAVACLEAYRQQGVVDSLDALAAHRRAVHQLVVTPGDPLFEALLPTLGRARQLGRVNAARMHLALQADDGEELLAAFESGLALARFCRYQPSLIEGLVGIDIEETLHGRVRPAILAHPEGHQLDAIEAALARQLSTVPRADCFRSDSMFGLDTIAWLFSDQKNARFGRFSPALNSSAGSAFGMIRMGEGRLGTYAENRDWYKAAYQGVIEVAAFDAYERPALARTDTRGLLLLHILVPSFNRTLRAFDILEAHRRATTTMLALERFYLAHRAYPDTLSPLVPDYLPALPLDPWTGHPLIYRPNAPDNKTYLLYAVGADATDSGGDPGNGRGREPDLVLSPAAE